MPRPSRWSWTTRPPAGNGCAAPVTTLRQKPRSAQPSSCLSQSVPTIRRLTLNQTATSGHRPRFAARQTPSAVHDRTAPAGCCGDRLYLPPCLDGKRSVRDKTPTIYTTRGDGFIDLCNGLRPCAPAADPANRGMLMLFIPAFGHTLVDSQRNPTGGAVHLAVHHSERAEPCLDTCRNAALVESPAQPASRSAD
jgi:hypothetical protein